MGGRFAGLEGGVGWWGWGGGGGGGEGENRWGGRSLLPVGRCLGVLVIVGAMWAFACMLVAGIHHLFPSA